MLYSACPTGHVLEDRDDFLRRPADRGAHAASRLYGDAVPMDSIAIRSEACKKHPDRRERQVKNLAVMPWNDHYITTPNYHNHADKGDFI